jgi:hypothetical protein
MANSESTIRPVSGSRESSPDSASEACCPLRAKGGFLYALQSCLFDGTLNWADRNHAAAAKLPGCFMLENGDCH